MLPRASVAATVRRSTTTLLEVCTGAGCVVTTPEHPFARSTGWTRASGLKIGDVIEAASGNTKVGATRVLPVSATEVYNLTIEKTHAYFAGSGALLVHNGCGTSKSPEGTAAERAQRHAKAVERDAREMRTRRLLEAHRRRMNRINLNDSHPDAPNCAPCTLAALSDADKLSTFLNEHNLDDNVIASDVVLQRNLNLLGLTHFQAGPPMTYEDGGLKRVWEQLLQAGADRFTMTVRRYLSRMLEPKAREYMQALSGNTNMVIYRWLERVEEPPGSGQFKTIEMAHALISVRREDGEIVYVDFQNVPPRVYRQLPNTTYHIRVFPTDVDWRYNRQIFAALRDGTVVPSL